MPTTSTARLNQIAADLRSDGLYMSANSVEAVAAERDMWRERALRFADGGPLLMVEACANCIETRVAAFFDTKSHTGEGKSLK